MTRTTYEIASPSSLTEGRRPASHAFTTPVVREIRRPQAAADPGLW
jgi:hypothetical protein